MPFAPLHDEIEGDRRPLLGGEGVVEDEVDGLDAASNDATNNALTACVDAPRRSREHAMERCPVTPARDIRRNECRSDESARAGSSLPDRAQPAIVPARGSAQLRPPSKGRNPSL
jgi:hypothetical protein